ncbi:MAG: hypothetical protein QXI49_05000 [Candidatus Methanomethylicaceae archaeon]
MMIISLNNIINSIKIATKVLSKFPNLNMIINNIRPVNLNLLTEWILENEFFYVILKSRFNGSFSGKISTIMDMASCDELINNITGKHIKVLNDYEKSILQEFFNIFIGAFLANYTNEYINYEIPEISILTSYEIIKEINDDWKIFKIGCDRPIISILLLLNIENYSRKNNELNS